jgi:hypothetical protein
VTNVFRMLRLDHETIETTLVRLETDRIPAGADPDRLRSRKKLVERLIMEESQHEAVEEEYFSP